MSFWVFPPEMKIGSYIDRLPDTQHISTPPYPMDPAKLKELKN